jgi:hypothetical protein
MTSFTPPVTLEHLIEASHAHPAFKADLLAFAAFQDAARIDGAHAPRVKVLRVVCQLLAAEPELAVETVQVRGASGCADFRGEVAVSDATGRRTWEFVWDCRWRAREAGLTDPYGRLDQARAAREYGWQCFAVWRERASSQRAAG